MSMNDLFAPEGSQLTVLSFGGGQDSSALLEMFLDDPEFRAKHAPNDLLVCMADTGDEFDATYRHVRETQARCEAAGVEFVFITSDYFLKLRLNDQILFTQNHPGAGVQNGSLGKLISVDQAGDVVGVVKLDTGDNVEIEGNLLDALDLGYATTLHKAQGSQFPRVIVLLKEGRVLDRSWLYTALTRAETEVHVIGSPEVFRKVTEAPSKAFKRKTLLTELIDFLGSRPASS